jgi:hypothetical protein
MANSAPGGANDFNTKIIEEFRANEGRVGGPWAGTTPILIHHIGAKSGIERVSSLACSLRETAAARSSPPMEGLQPTQTGTTTSRQPQDQRRGGYPDVHGTGGGAGRHRPRPAVAEADRGVSYRRRTPDQDHATDSGVHADPPGLTQGLGKVPDRLVHGEAPSGSLPTATVRGHEIPPEPLGTS